MLSPFRSYMYTSFYVLRASPKEFPSEWPSQKSSKKSKIIHPTDSPFGWLSHPSD
uniref:Uncharacterized protein n=1 Tax=Arundo donax TaxID=35708 RepID=A0A0A8ZJP1_ARUDO